MKKVWDDKNNENHRPLQITIALTIGDEEVERVVLSQANQWQHIFTNLPTNVDYSIKEIALSGNYSSEIKKTVDENGNVEFIITNTFNNPEKPKPEKPKPEKPKPEKPTPEKPTPEKPTPEQPKPEKPEVNTPDENKVPFPQTGNNMVNYSFIGLFMLVNVLLYQYLRYK